jgi:hypothetical protein
MVTVFLRSLRPRDTGRAGGRGMRVHGYVPVGYGEGAGWRIRSPYEARDV